MSFITLKGAVWGKIRLMLPMGTCAGDGRLKPMRIELGRVQTPGQHAPGYPNPDDELTVWFDAESEDIEWHAHYTWDSLMDEVKTYCGRTVADEWLGVLSEE